MVFILMLVSDYLALAAFAQPDAVRRMAPLEDGPM